MLPFEVPICKAFLYIIKEIKVVPRHSPMVRRKLRDSGVRPDKEAKGTKRARQERNDVTTGRGSHKSNGK
jgi:hypothetical protein